jgi:hypothetical protein
MAATGEMYSWAGESRFSDRDLLDMVQGGAITTGGFGAFLASIFGSDDASFTYDGETTQNGRTLSEFGFRVPYEKSHYLYGEPPHRVTTGYDGTFLVDARTAELVRLSVRTSRLPAETGACYASNTLDYARVSLNGSDFLLPSVAFLRIFKPDGSELMNRTVFAGCHAFLGESALTFDPPPGTSASAADTRPVSQAPVIPPGLRFRVAFTAGVDTATAAAGDLIGARLTTPIRNRSKVLVPKGAAVRARIVRIRQYYAGIPAVLFEFKLETVDSGGVSTRLAAKPDVGQSLQTANGRALQQRVEPGTLGGLQESAVTWTYWRVRLPYVIPNDRESMWLTAASDSVSTSTR